MDRKPVSLPLKIFAALGFAFLLAPVAIVIPLSFSSDVFMSFPPSGYSLRWYLAIGHNAKIIDAFFFSLKLAIAVTILNIVVAVPAAYVLMRRRPPGADAILGVLTAPLLLPTIVLGLALLIVLARAGLLATPHGLFFAHVIVTLPYALRVIATALSTLPVAVEEAAMTLGASPLVLFFRITLPMMMPGIVAAAALSFLVSFDEVVLSLFLSGPKAATLPVELYHHVESRADPLVAAASTLLVMLTLAVVVVVDRSLGLTRTFVK